MNRIVGLETEYGCLVDDPGGPQSVVTRIRNWAFEKNRLGLADIHQRDWDEPAGNGGFLFNGGRLYLDMGHLEYCTPECSTLREVLAYDRAGDLILLRALKELRLQERVGIIRNNIDHYTGATFGCHENYLMRREAAFTEANTASLLAFLTLRMLYTGAGRVGSSTGAENRGDHRRQGAHPHFQISQRADYITNELFEWVQFNRAIINTRDEPLADPKRYRRLHLLHGDTSILPFTTFLKIGTTSLVLDLLEMDRLPAVALADAVEGFHSLSHQPQGDWFVRQSSGTLVSAMELLDQFRARAALELRGRDEETDLVLSFWQSTLEELGSRPSALVGRVDWITKFWLFHQFMEKEGLDWTDPWMRAQDLEFHQIHPDRSLALALANTPPECAVDEVFQSSALRHPPSTTRACVRSWLMNHLAQHHIEYCVDWDCVEAEDSPTLLLADPFASHPPEAEAWAKALHLIG